MKKLLYIFLGLLTSVLISFSANAFEYKKASNSDAKNAKMVALNVVDIEENEYAVIIFDDWRLVIVDDDNQTVSARIKSKEYNKNKFIGECQLIESSISAIGCDFFIDIVKSETGNNLIIATIPFGEKSDESDILITYVGEDYDFSNILFNRNGPAFLDYPESPTWKEGTPKQLLNCLKEKCR